MGHSMTLAQDCSDRTALERHILHLAEKVGRRLRRGAYRGRTVSLVLRFADFHTFSRQRRLRHAVNLGLDIHAAAMGIFRGIELAQPVRLVGVGVSGLERHAAQVPLFEDDRRRRPWPRPWTSSTTGTAISPSPGGPSPNGNGTSG
jgi:DNA polymerase-4